MYEGVRPISGLVKKVECILALALRYRKSCRTVCRDELMIENKRSDFSFWRRKGLSADVHECWY